MAEVDVKVIIEAEDELFKSFEKFKKEVFDKLSKRELEMDGFDLFPEIDKRYKKFNEDYRYAHREFFHGKPLKIFQKTLKQFVRYMKGNPMLDEFEDKLNEKDLDETTKKLYTKATELFYPVYSSLEEFYKVFEKETIVNDMDSVKNSNKLMLLDKNQEIHDLVNSEDDEEIVKVQKQMIKMAEYLMESKKSLDAFQKAYDNLNIQENLEKLFKKLKSGPGHRFESGYREEMMAIRKTLVKFQKEEVVKLKGELPSIMQFVRSSIDYSFRDSVNDQIQDFLDLIDHAQEELFES